MALPTSRDQTFAALSQVPSAVLNNIQDQTVGGLHGVITVPVGFVEAVETGGASRANEGIVLNGLAETARFPLRLPHGAILTAATMFFDSAAGIGVSPTCTIERQSFENEAVDSGIISTSKTIPTTGGDQSCTWTTADTDIPYTALDNDAVFLRAYGETGTVAVTIRGITYSFEKTS